MEINLQDVTKENWMDMVDLEITTEQKRYVAHPSEAIAASKFYEYYINRGIYLGDQPVGFMQYYPNFRDCKPSEIFLDQLIIDVNLQGRGYGTKAVALALKEIQCLKEFNSISICYVEGHDVMRQFFERFGFKVIEQDEYDETIMELHFA